MKKVFLLAIVGCICLLSGCAATTCYKLDALIIEQRESWQSTDQDFSGMAMYHLGILQGYEFAAVELGCELKSEEAR